MSTTNSHPRIILDDDVDDLDDVLDQFSPNQIPAPPPTATLGLPTVGRPRQNTRVGAPPPSLPGSSGSKLDLTAEANEDDLSEEFARELAKGMEDLMKGLEGDSSTGEEGGVDFKARLKNAMKNMKESESKLQGASGAGVAPTPESLAALLGSLGDGETDGETDKEIEGFLEVMMRQLLSKDVLQEPLKELSDGFPAYLAKPPVPLSEDDRQRYVKQQACVSKVLKVFDKADYREDHPEYSREVVDLMSEMQSYGSPPSEIMGDLPPGFDAFNKTDEKDCIIS